MYDNGIVKIGDFGWATTFKNRKSTTYCGTLDYVSP
jgi:serine/threonine protein kinase